MANRNLAAPVQPGMAQGAAVLDNFFPTSTSVILRRGKEINATLGDGTLDTTSLFSYVVGTQQRLFGSTATTIYDITTISTPINYTLGTEEDDTIVTDLGDTIGDNSTLGYFEVFEGSTGGNWIVVQFATTGGIFLVGVNGESTGFIYDQASFYPNVPGGVWTVPYDTETTPFQVGEIVTGGTSGATGTVIEIIESSTPGEGALILTGTPELFENDESLSGSLGGGATASGDAANLVPGVSFPSPETLTTADLAFVFAYKNRLIFIQKETLDWWYLPVDQIGGELARFPLGGVFQRGGSLLFGASWSLDSGSSGGLSEQCVFVTTEGEVAVYQGDDPSTAANWSKVGVYRIGRPLGNKAWIRAGGDLVIATSVGFVPLSQAIQRDYAALSPSAVSYPIEDAWNEATRLRGLEGWNCEIWPESQMVCVSPPRIGEGQPVLFVANARTGAWARYTNWRAICMHVFQGQLYMGDTNGRVYAANVSGLDDGSPYTGAYMALFEDLGNPASLKIGQMARATVRARYEINEVIAFQTDFDQSLPAAPSASSAGSGNEWGTATWGQSTWGTVSPDVINQRWQSVGGAGYTVSASLQVTSGSVVPLDAELIRTEFLYQQADIIS